MYRKPRKSGPAPSALPNASNQAIVGVSAPSPLPASRRQSQQGHPFATVNTLAPNERSESYDPSNMAIPSQAGMQPIAPMTVNGRAGNTAANSQQVGEADFQTDEGKGSGGLMRLLSCGCCR